MKLVIKEEVIKSKKTGSISLYHSLFFYVQGENNHIYPAKCSITTPSTDTDYFRFPQHPRTNDEGLIEYEKVNIKGIIIPEIKNIFDTRTGGIE